VTLGGLNIVGSESLDRNDTAPLVWLDSGARDVSLADSALDACGQQGVQVSQGAQGIELDRLSITVHAQEGSAGDVGSRIVFHARPGVNVDGPQQVQLTLRRSRIIVDDTRTEHAAVVVGGSGITVEENHIQALADVAARGPRAWGGVQVLSGSRTVRIAGNQIVGGYGHGITLGSVVWVAADDPGERLFGFEALGAGAGQTGPGPAGSSVVNGRVNELTIASPFTNIDTPYVPDIEEGAVLGISDLVITDNRIEGMSTNGISALTVLGLPNGALQDVDSVRIERNAITGNLVNLAQHVLTTQPLTLSASTNLAFIQIPRIPYGGIVLATGIDIQIRDNTIVGNGTSGLAPINGIFVLNGDTIDVDGNRITDNGGRAPANTQAFVRPGPRAGIAVMLAGSGNASTVPALIDVITPPTEDLDSGGVALRVTNNTVRHPEGRALEVLASGPVHIQGNYLTSQGSAGGDVPSEQLQVGDLVYVLNLGGAWERFGLNFTDPSRFDFTSPELAFETLLAHHPDVTFNSPYRYIAEGGGVLFNNNHTILDWDVQRPPTLSATPLAFFPVALLTLDHLGMMGNHLALRLQNVPANLPSSFPGDVTEPILSHLLALGLTLKIELNRFSENVTSVAFSLMARADLMSSTVFNQSTHDIYSIRQVRFDNFLDVSNNQVLFLRNTPLFDGNTDPLRDTLQSLFGLLFTPPPS
jgi:hypothetical protein